MLYLPLFQSYQSNAVLHVRTRWVARRLSSRRYAARCYALDQDLPIYAVRTMDEHVTATLTPQRLLAYLIGGFGVLALLLAAIGLYGLLAYTVAERTPEIGLRMAIGAHQADVMRLFVADGMKLALAGVILGSVAALGVTTADEEPGVRDQPPRSLDVRRSTRASARCRPGGVRSACAPCRPCGSQDRSALRVKHCSPPSAHFGSCNNLAYGGRVSRA